MMTRLLYYVTYFVVICLFTTLSLPGVASESDIASTVERTALELGYGVQAYECDKQMNPLASDDRVTKIVGTVILICFVPNQEALNDGIGLKEINHFKWETTTKAGDALRRDAITNGKGDGALSTVRCLNSLNLQDQIELEGKEICIMESMLPSNFYVDTASIMGSGEATFQIKDRVDGTVPVSVDIFQGKFSFKFDPETKKLLESMHAQNAALDSNSTTSTGDEDEVEYDVEYEVEYDVEYEIEYVDSNSTTFTGDEDEVEYEVEYDVEYNIEYVDSNSTTSTGDEDVVEYEIEYEDETESLSSKEKNDSVSNSDDTKENDNKDEGKDEL